MAAVNIEVSLQKLLTDAVGGTGAVVYPAGAVDQEQTLPYVTYSDIADSHISTTTGFTGLRQATFQIDVWGDTYSIVKSISNDIAVTLRGYRGTVLGTKIRGIMQVDSGDSPEMPDAGREIGQHRVTMDFKISAVEG